MKKLKTKIGGASKKLVKKLIDWIISGLKKAFVRFNEFIAKQTWIVTAFALIGGGYVLYLSGTVFFSYIYEELEQRFTKVIIIENVPVQTKEEKEEEKEELLEVEEIKDPIEMEISKKFPEEPNVMKAIFMAESSLKTDAKGWNCIYTVDNKKQSRACQAKDRKKAWSVDCGLAQINVSGQSCPVELFDLATNLEVARKKYDTQGKNAWSAYKNQSYKKFL